MLIVVVIIGILAAALIPRLQSVQARARDTKRKADLHQIGTALEIYKEDNSSLQNISNAQWARCGIAGYPVDKTTCTTNCVRDPFDSNNQSLSQRNPIAESIKNYMTSIPHDTDAWIRKTVWCDMHWYFFSALKNHGQIFQWFLLAARTESDWSSSNWISHETDGYTQSPARDEQTNTYDSSKKRMGALAWWNGNSWWTQQEQQIDASIYQKNLCTTVVLSSEPNTACGQWGPDCITYNDWAGACTADKNSWAPWWDLRYIYVQ